METPKHKVVLDYRKTLQKVANTFFVDISNQDRVIDLPNSTRDTLAIFFNELGFEVGVEVGVERGKYSEVLLDKNPNVLLYSIDGWTSYNDYRNHVSDELYNEIYEDAKNRLKRFGTRSLLVKGFSPQIADTFDDESLDFVYLDANHEFTAVVNDIEAWKKKVKIGGIIAGHDYIKSKRTVDRKQVPYAVDAYCDAYDIRPLFVLGRKEAPTNIDPFKGELRERTRSWFFVKEYK